ncbi:hypothetical protein XELAEV_18002698mg [Xenopus laevis]|nr:hypothetical protein XELAEV_18002698mg [Xenopus laevis]
MRRFFPTVSGAAAADLVIDSALYHKLTDFMGLFTWPLFWDTLRFSLVVYFPKPLSHFCFFLQAWCSIAQYYNGDLSSIRSKPYIKRSAFFSLPSERVKGPSNSAAVYDIKETASIPVLTKKGA